jgi:hypothetical protein
MLCFSASLVCCRCKLRRGAPQALAQGLRLNRTLRQLNLAGCQGLDDAGAAALTSALACSKVLSGINLAFVKLGAAAVDSLVQVRSNASKRVVFTYFKASERSLICW